MTMTTKRNNMLDSLDHVFDDRPVASVSIFDQYTFGFL